MKTRLLIPDTYVELSAFIAQHAEDKAHWDVYDPTYRVGISYLGIVYREIICQSYVEFLALETFLKKHGDFVLEAPGKFYRRWALMD